MSLPDFFIIGAPKCGTTTLYNWLGRHPEVNAPHKEPCFFSQDIFPTSSLPTHIESLSEYTSIFNFRAATQRISGEATPKYLYSDMALNEIKRLCPDARVIVCFRDPVDLVISLHYQKFREGEEKESSFVKAWRRTVDHNGTVLSRDANFGGQPNYYFWGAYGCRLKKLYELFTADQILLVGLNEIQSDPETTYKKLIDFLGIDDDGRTSFGASNVGFKIKRPWLHRFAVFLKRVSAPVLRSLHRARDGRGLGLLKLLNRYNTEVGAYSIGVSEDLRVEIREVLLADIEMAERIFDVYLGASQS